MRQYNQQSIINYKHSAMWPYNQHALLDYILHARTHKQRILPAVGFKVKPSLKLIAISACGDTYYQSIIPVQSCRQIQNLWATIFKTGSYQYSDFTWFRINTELDSECTIGSDSSMAMSLLLLLSLSFSMEA